MSRTVCPGHSRAIAIPRTEASTRAKILNDEWVAAAVRDRRTVYLASPPTAENLWDSVAERSTVFGRELQMFLDAGYVRRGDYLVWPD